MKNTVLSAALAQLILLPAEEMDASDTLFERCNQQYPQFEGCVIVLPTKNYEAFTDALGEHVNATHLINSLKTNFNVFLQIFCGVCGFRTITDALVNHYGTAQEVAQKFLRVQPESESKEVEVEAEIEEPEEPKEELKTEPKTEPREESKVEPQIQVPTSAPVSQPAGRQEYDRTLTALLQALNSLVCMHPEDSSLRQQVSVLTRQLSDVVGVIEDGALTKHELEEALYIIEDQSPMLVKNTVMMMIRLASTPVDRSNVTNFLSTYLEIARQVKIGGIPNE